MPTCGSGVVPLQSLNYTVHEVRAVPAWLDELNPAQRLAVTHGEGPLLVIAGAGTGKTKTLACRVAHLIDRGVPPDGILLLTFTRRAAAEMIRRARHITGRAATDRVWGGTFHAVANRLLRIYARAVGLSPEFTVIDQADAADMMNIIRSDLGLTGGDRRFPAKATLAKIYSHTVNAQRPLRETLECHFPWCLDDMEAMGQIFERYVQRKAENHLLDYDDLLLYWKMLTSAPRVGRRVADRFNHILVDEYQDTNIVQAQILRGMRRKDDNIVVVGDDAQSIYSFRAATIRNILDFPTHFPGATTVTLEQNYRSTGPILTVANAVMEQAGERYTKDLWSDRVSGQKPVLVHCEEESAQTEAVCLNVLAHLEEGIPLMQQAVLFRASHHSADLEVDLSRRNIPFHKFGGLRFTEAAHIRDVLAYLRILENPFDRISWFRVLQLLGGVGPRTAQRIINSLNLNAGSDKQTSKGGSGSDASRTGGSTAAASGAVPLDIGSRAHTPLARLFAEPPAVPPAARHEFGAMRNALADCSGVSLAVGQHQAGVSAEAQVSVRLPVPAQVERIARFYKPILECRYENAPVRLRDLDQLEHIAARYKSRGRFITDLTLDPPTSTSELADKPYLEEDYLTLSTIHSAKGCEWRVVHIIHAADGMIPSDMAVQSQAGVDEERRLLYVAMTRAKDFLYVYFPQRYYHRRFSLGDRYGYAQLTRFIPDDMRRLFEERVGRTVDDNDDGECNDAEPTRIDGLDSFLKDLWRT
ncbi:MAG: ATP-dependent helicase [Phycisphaerae bacterium]